jgi:hypothetical protein
MIQITAASFRSIQIRVMLDGRAGQGISAGRQLAAQYNRRHPILRADRSRKLRFLAAGASADVSGRR